MPRGFRARRLGRDALSPAGFFASPGLLGVSTSFDGPTLADAGYFPPDTDAAAGTSQVLVVLNGRIKVYAKNGTAGALDATLNTFFASVLSAGADSVDPRVVFDTTTKRWFVSAIDVPASLASNRVMLAVSDSDTITSGTVWTFFQFQHDTIGGAGDSGDFADFPTLGVDLNAVYIGNSIYTPAGDFVNTSIFVIKKASVLAAGPIVVTPFRDLIPDVDGGSNGMLTAQGATNGDVSATAGYIVGTDWGEFSTLNVRRVTNPGSNTPTLSADMPVAVNKTFYPGSEQGDGIRVVGSTNKLDGGDDRLSAAMIQNGKLYTAEAIGIVDSTGTVADFSNPPSTFPTRTGARWYELSSLSSTPVVARQGTIFDSTTNVNPKSFWMPSIAVSRQGHAVIGMSSGGGAARPNGAASSMLSGQNSFTSPVDFTASAANYNVGLQGSLLRWGDYSMTTVDPCDGQTFWTIQEYVPSVDNWGVKVAKVMAPGPATPSTLSPAAIATGQASVDVTVTGTSASGSGFWDTGAGSCRIAAAVSGGVTVNSATFTDATHITLNVSTVGAVTGTAHDLTITNPDGQTTTKVAALTVGAPPANTALPTISGTPLQNGTVLTADPGTWSGFPASTFAYQWERCNAAGNACGDISAATASTYTLAAPADTAQTIRVRVTASNGVPPNATAESAATAQIAGPPASTAVPTISGTTAVGDTLTAANGTWSGYPAPTFAYQWHSCDSGGVNCSDLGGETASTHVVVSADAGHTLRVVVTATNGSGSASATSATVGVPGASSNLTPPSITGTPQTGSTLTAAPGSWLGVPAPTFSYQWERCDVLGAACSDIALATASTYVPGVSDLGSTLRVKVSGSNTGGAAGPFESAQTAVITNPPSGGGGGGGRGGGGGAGTSDLVAGISAPATAKIGDAFTYQVSAQDIGTGGSDHVVATITLPSGVTLGGVSFDRGAGCTGTTVLTCQLDFLNGSLVAHIALNVSVTANGSLVATVVLTSSKPDINPANNTASATTVVAASTPPPPNPGGGGLPAPKLTRTGTAAIKPVRGKTTAAVSFGVRLNRAARVKMSVKPQGRTKALLLLAGTRLGTTTRKTSAFVITAARGSGAFAARAVFDKTALTRGKTYVVTLVATAPDGRKSTLTVRFTA